MAFNIKALSRFNTSDRGALSQTNFYHYSTEDAAAVVLADGYFNAARSILKKGDCIQAVAVLGGTPDYLNILILTVPDTGNVTCAANTGASGA